MDNMKCLEAKVTPVLLLGIWLVCFAQFVAGSSWYLGCIHDNASSEASVSLLQDLKGNSVFTPASCAGSCRERGFLYAKLHEQGANCTCINLITGERIADEQCNITCGNVSLPCGGDGALSVYSVDGPYLLSAELSQTQHLVQEGATVRFEARVALATTALTDLGLEGISASDFNEIIFKWQVDGDLLGETSLRYGNSTAVGSFVHTFHREGSWHIDVDVSNAISSLARTTGIAVVRPLPSDLQVILGSTEGDAPSCVPMSSAASTSLPTVSVFTGEEVEFQASVAMGVNLTFVWTFIGDGLNLTGVTTSNLDCAGIACMQDTQIRTFTAEGMYDVVVNVSNVLGSVQKTLHVVVVSREITNLTMSLSSNSAFINKVNSSLGLLITMATTARQQVILQVDFGDGSIFNHSMYDVNDTFITVGSEESAHLHLAASYGEGCTLFISLSHRYRQAGLFDVEASVFQSWDSQRAGTAELESAIIVQEELGPIQIETQRVYSTHYLANFSLVMPVYTANMSYQYLWSVTSNNATIELACYLEPTCFHNFTQPGQYLLKVSVSNLVSIAHAQEVVSIQEAIRGLSLIGGRGGILATGATVLFTAFSEAGSDTQFSWHFSHSLGMTEQRDYFVDAIPTSQANHTFYASGVYNVSITASNTVSSVTAFLPQILQVQDTVIGLNLISTGSTILGHPTHINVTLLQGTHVTFAVHTDVGQVTTNIQHRGGDNTYILELVIGTSGVFYVTVVASNNISSDNATLCVVVQELVGMVSIQEFYPGNGQIVLLARLDGEIPNRTDVMYTWQARGRNLTSASPLLTLPVYLQTEQVVIQASNQVDVSQEERTINSTLPETKYSLDCPTFGEAGEPMMFSLQVHVSGDGNLTPVQVLIDHGDGTPNVSRTAIPGLPLVWNHTSLHPGVHPLRLWYHCEGEDIFGEAATVVQKKIEGVQMIGPQLSKFFGPVTIQTWEVTLTSGTDILYTWTVLPIATDYSRGIETSAEVNVAAVRVAGSYGKVSIPFHAPGQYNITLHATNLISSATHHFQTTLQQPIVQATVLLDPALSGTPSTYQLVVQGGPPFHFQIGFEMNGSLLSTMSQELAALGRKVINYRLDPPVCVYQDLGWYDSSFLVRIWVSEETVAATAKVEEWITGLTLTSRSASLVATGQSVVLEATVETGNDVVFTWDFQDSEGVLYLLYCFNASIANYTFSRPATYQVSVSAKNSLQPTPLRVTYPTPFLVLEPPHTLELNAPAGRPQGAALVYQGGEWATEVLSFRALCWGSDLVFYFDYGDATVEKVLGLLDGYGSFQASGSHRYFTEGNYTVRVIAGNQLSNETISLPRPYYVQVPPTSLQCQSPLSAQVFGNVSRLAVRVQTGTHLFYNWSMGDQTDYINVGPTVTHQYRSPGHYTVTIVAFNKVEKDQTTCRIAVEVHVQGVQLLAEGRLHQTHTHIILEARTVTNSALWYHWDMGDQREVQITSVSTLTYSYTIPGRYYVTVLAGNNVGNATSLPVELILQKAVRQVSIHAQGAALVNQTVCFQAWFKGSDMSFVWDFGDGTEKVYTTASSIYHKYNRTGEFLLYLEASNLVSNATATSNIFILTTMCNPPVLDIVGSDLRIVRHSEDIRVEAEVAIDCDITNLALYSWSVTCSQNGSEVLLPEDRASLNQRTLYIPRWDLPYGAYTFTLDVVMNGTIVYAQDSIKLDVVRTPLISIIEGGTRRYVGPDTIATLNGSLSFDPDDRNSNDNLRYNWTCHPLGLPSASCFNATALSTANQTAILPSSNASLIFPTSWLLSNNSRSFVFTLRIGKEDRAQAETSQVLTLVQEVVGAEGRQMQVSIDCLKCEDGVVNANEQLTLETVCLECDENTTYTWQLYLVLEGTTSNSFYDLMSGRRCVPGSGSYSQYLVANESFLSLPSSNPEEDNNVINQGTQTITTSTPQNGVSNAINMGLLPSEGREEGSAADSSQSNSSSVYQISGENPSGTASTAAATAISDPGNFTEGFASLTEEGVGADEETVGSHDEGTTRLEEADSSFQEAGSSYEEVVEDIEEEAGRNPGVAAGSVEGTLAPTTEGSQTGSSLTEGFSEDTSQQNQNVSQPVDGDDSPDDEDYYEEYLGDSDDPGLHPPPPPDPNTGEDDSNDGDPVVNPDMVPTVKQHIVSKSLQERLLRPQDTTTGLGSRALTIKPGFLDENRTYALVVSVHKKENGVMKTGKVQQYVSVNRGPRAGLCSVTPDEGNEMDTVFTINCLDWQDEHSPIQYEVSYSLNETEDLTILYFGMKHAIKFQLPAGYRDNDHLVYVKVAIVDGQGGKTSVCSITIQVLPNMFGPGETVEEFLYNVTLAESNMLTRYVQRGDQHNLNSLINMVACILNRQPRLGPGSSDYARLSLRRRIRFALISAVLALPMRDLFEVQQSAMATATSSYVPLELQVDTVILAAYSVKSSLTAAVANARLLGQLDVDILAAMTGTMSSVVSALAMDHTPAIRLGQRKVAVGSSVGAVMELLQMYLQLQKPNEEPLLIQTSSVDLLGARQTSLATVTLMAGTNAFLLPNGIEQVLHAQNGGGAIGAYLCHGVAVPCWDVDMVTFKDNPYLWGEGAYKVTTDVSSLTLHSCTGQQLKVENLTAGKEIIFEVAHSCGSLGDSLTCNLTIDKGFMNVHGFNVSQENIGQTFQIMTRLAPETRRTFPVKLVMRYGAKPTPTAYDRFWMYGNEDNDLVLFLPPNTFNVSGTYYIALINAEYGDSGYGQDEVRTRQYLIRLWWEECLYWNAENEAWVGDGCAVMRSSTYELTRCKCNHLTTFGATFLPISVILDIVNLAVFDTPNTNPITYSFTAGILSIYVLLCIYCYLADKHDSRKLGLIYLADNQPADQQYYEITVETGMRAGAGTTARVSMVLHGEEGHSETKELICKGRPIFEKNSRDRFIVSVPESLGSIRRVHVWHNNAGPSPSWFLSRVAVRDLLTGHKWYFISEHWFAVEEDDGKIERDLEVLEKGVGFQKAFFAKLFQYFSDYYLWSSVFTRPPYSVFTRVQRLTCCLSISMGFLCINTVWYQYKEEVDLGQIDVSGEAMLVGIVTAILAIPVNFPVIMLFRRARPRHDEIEEEKNFRSAKATIELPESAAPVETILNQGSLDSGVGEQSDANLEDLPQWVQEKWRQRLKGTSNNSGQTPRSYDSISFTTSSSSSSSSLGFDETPSSGLGSNTTTKPSDSGVSSPDSRSLLSGYLPAVAAAGWQADHKRLANPKVWLPSWCRTLAWIVCGIITAFSAVITIYYGYRFSDVKSVYWMQSVYFSFLQCIFVTQPAVMLMFTILKSVRHRNNIHIFDHYDDNIDLIDKKSLERARLELYETDMNKAIAARQRSRYLRFARPPQPKELQKAKEKMLKEKNMWAILKDVTMYSTLFTCLMWMAYGREVAYHHPVNQGVRQTYLQTPHPFTAVSSVEDLWSWLHGDLLDRLYWEEWYNTATVVEEKNSIMSGESILLGKASLRQVRVRHHSCPVARPARLLFADCKAGYSSRVESTEPYGPESAWGHASKGKLRRYSKWGYFGSYEGDGYAVSLNNSRKETRNQLAFLQKNSWIDDQTRAVIVEFTIYNTPTNLYTSVAFLAEMPGTGAVHPFPKIESVLLYRYETAYDYFIMGCELLFLLLVAVSGKREVQKLVKIRATFFKSPWSWMEMGMIVLSLAYFAMYVCRFMYVNDATLHLRETYLEEFVDFSLLAYWDQILKDLLASIIFLSSVKFLHLLRFNQTVARFGAVIDGAFKEILTFALYLLVLEAAFACLGFLLFSTYFYPLKHLYVSSTLLNSMVIVSRPQPQPLGYGDLDVEFPLLWYLFYSAYAFSMIIFMAGLIKAVLCHSYRRVKRRRVPAVGGTEVICFFWDKVLIRVGLREMPEEEKPAKLPTEFTMAEIEYQVDELLFRMSALTHQHGLPEKTYGYFDDSDGTHNTTEDGMYSTCSELNSIDSARLDDRAQNLELGELLDGNCFTDEDREKYLRSGLHTASFQHLRQRRPQHDLHDSGHDTQSTSEHMELGSDVVSAEQPLPSTTKPLNVPDAQGRSTYPKPLQTLGTLETVPALLRPPSAIFTNRKRAWGQSRSAEETTDSQRPPRVAIPQDRHSDRRPHTAGVNKRTTSEHILKPASAAFARRDRQLVSSSEVLDSQSSSSSSSLIHRTDSPSSHTSDTALAASLGNRNRGTVQVEPAVDPGQLVRDYPEGGRPTVERAFSDGSFPLPNALVDLASSSDEDTTKLKNKGSRESKARHRLRKTRSRGKGKGRRRFDEAIYVNDAFSSDSGDDGDVTVIHVRPTIHHEGI